jgi:acetolactate synthase-1/2/3 large subunit
MATLGPGALNLVTGAAYAHLGAMPMILITGQKAIMSARQARFQIVDIVATMKPLTKSSRQIISAASIPTVVRDAFRLASEERPGPVHLELPEDIAGEQLDREVPLVRAHPIEIPVAHPNALDRAAELLMRAERPLVMFGAASSRPRLSGQLTDFVRRVGIPFFNTQMGKGTVAGLGTTEGGTELWMGTAALSDRDYVHEAIDQADLILSIGHDTIEKPPFIMGPKGPKVIHVGYTPANVEEVYFPDAEVIGDLGPSLALLADRVQGKLPNAGALVPLRENIIERTLARSEESRFPLTPQRIVSDVRKVMPADGIVALDNGMYKIWFARCYRTRNANALLLDNALATMGAGLPSAMLAAMLSPGKRVLAVCGDGGFMMNSQELETAVRLKLDLVVLIIQDDAYGMIRWKQAVDNFADWGLAFGNPDFVKYAEAYGAKGRRVETAESLVATLEAAFAEGGVQLVTVPVDYSENSRVLVDELRNRVREVTA